MKQEDKELLLKDLCARLPYGFKYQVIYDNRTPQSVKNIILDGDFTLFDGWLVHEIKPYLRPMSSMTKEERLYFHRNSARVQILVDEEKVITKPFYGYTVHLLDWLNTHHFDYRGLIPKGLALEAPEDMYN